MSVVANASGVIIGNDGKRLYGMDAELHQKREAQRDPEFELLVAQWIEKASGETLVDTSDLWVSLKNGVVLCTLVNCIVPGTIKKFAKTNMLPLMEMDNIQLYLKACWNLGVPSGDFFIVSDLYHNKSIYQVIQNIVSLSRVAQKLGFPHEPIVSGNTGKDRVKNWEPVASGIGQPLHVDQLLEAGSPAERITELTIEVGRLKHDLGHAKSEVHNVQQSMKEMKEVQRAEREKWVQEREAMQNRLKKFAPIDTGEDGEAGSLALQALELQHKEVVDALKQDLAAERTKLEALETKLDEQKKKYSAVSAELSKLKFEMGSKQQQAQQQQQTNKPSWMKKVQEKKEKEKQQETVESRDRARTRTRTRTIMAQPLAEKPPVLQTQSSPPSKHLGDSQTSQQPQEEVHYRGRLNTMMQVKTSSDGAHEADTETGFFFSSENLDADGLEYLSEQIEIIFSNAALEDDASTILNEMLFSDSGRRTFTFVLKEKLRTLHFQKVALDTGPFLQVLSLINSALTGMQLDSQVDYIAMTFLLGVSRSIYTTGSKSQMEEYLADHLRDHSIWSDVRFWEQHFWDVVGKAFKKKFNRLSLGSALGSGWADEHVKFLAQFVGSFAHEMRRWALEDAALNEFLKLVFERLQMPQKYQDITKAYLEKLAQSQSSKQVQDSQRLRHMSMVMSTAQAARIMGQVKAGGSSGNVTDTNILQGWVKRKVHIMWITEWVDQAGMHLNFKEFKQGTQKRIVINMSQLTRVEARHDQQLNSRTIFIEAGDMKVTIAPVKDTDAELNYWLNGLKKMQQRFNVAPGTVRPAAAVPSRSPRLGGAAAPPLPLSRSSGAAPPSPVRPAQAAGGGATLEGKLKLLVTKENGKRFKSLSNGWSPLLTASIVDGYKLHFANTNGDAAGVLDLTEMSHMPEVCQEDAVGKVIRIHTKDCSYDLSGFVPSDSFDAWIKGLSTIKKKGRLQPLETQATTAGSPSNLGSSSPSIPPMVKKEEVVAHTFKMGDMVWTQFVEDLLWYRGVIYFIESASLYKVVFIEYGNTQDCTSAQIRPIDDPAMLALAEKTLAEVTSPASIDKNRPLVVQVPAVIVQEIRRATRAGTVLRVDPQLALRQQLEERGPDEEEVPAPAPAPAPVPVAAVVDDNTPPVIAAPTLLVSSDSEDVMKLALEDESATTTTTTTATDPSKAKSRDNIRARLKQRLQSDDAATTSTAAATASSATPSSPSVSPRRSTIQEGKLSPRVDVVGGDGGGGDVEEEKTSPRRSTVGDESAAARVRAKLEQRKKEKEQKMLEQQKQDEDAILDDSDE